MTINRLQLIKGYWLNDIVKFRDIVNTHTWTNKNIDEIKKEIKINFDNNRSGKCINWIIIFLLHDQCKAMIEINKLNILKFSSEKNKNNISLKIITELLGSKDKLNLSSSVIKYLNSKLSFSKVIDEYFDIETNVISKMESIVDKRGSFVTDLIFLSDYFFHEIEIDVLKDKNIKEYDMNPEEIAESVSYLIELYYDKYGFSNNDNLSVDKNNVLYSEIYISIIKNASILKHVKEKEFLLDNYGYHCSFSNNQLSIVHEDELFEKSISYGFIYSELQKHNKMISDFKSRFTDAEEFYCHSLQSYLNKISKDDERIINLLNKPYQRYTVNIHMIDSIVEFFKEKAFFSEEIIDLLTNEEENITCISELLKFRVSKSLTLWDTIIIKRVLIFYMGLLHKKCKEIEVTNPEVALRSWLPVFEKDNLLKLLSYYISTEKAEEFIDLYTWDRNGLLDLQYTPIVKIKDCYYLCSNLLINSSTLRNTVIKERKVRPIEAGGSDVSSSIIYESLSKKFEHVGLEVQFDFLSFHGDFDVLMYCDGIVYAFECKNIIKPASIYELRSSQDNLKKGLSQLDKARSAFSDKSFVEYINNKLNWNIEFDNLKIVTCLVLSNRMFSGYNSKNNHVRSVYELSNFIDTGRVELESGSISLWSSENIENNDLYLYLEKDKLHSLVNNSIKYNEKRIFLAKKIILSREYYLDIEDSLGAIVKEFSLDIED